MTTRNTTERAAGRDPAGTAALPCPPASPPAASGQGTPAGTSLSSAVPAGADDPGAAAPHAVPGSTQLAAAMSEDSLDHAVRRILKDLPGVLGYHAHDSRRSHRGLPDWIFASAHGVMWRELKTEEGAVTPAQRAWLDVLTLAGQNAGVWRPSRLLDGTIARELCALAGMRVQGGGSG